MRFEQPIEGIKEASNAQEGNLARQAAREEQEKQRQ